MLSVRQLQAGYGKHVVFDIDALVFAPGEITVIVGPNGSGKSTLLRCLTGALKPESGSVLWETIPLNSLSAREIARRIAYVPQDTAYAFAFTVRELVTLGAEVGINAPGEREEHLSTALDVMELTGLAERGLQSLSGGERQRAAIARAVAQNAPCLLLDEPTAHLDLRYQSLLYAFLRRTVKNGASVIVVLHDLNAAANLADRIVLLSKGKIVAQGPPQETLTPESIQTVYGARVYFAYDAQSGSRWLIPNETPDDTPTAINN